MIEGMSYLQLYYNKSCTIELEKDSKGDYIYKTTNISTNAIMPLIINFWCKNNGSHTAYESSLQLVSSDIAVTMPPVKDKILSNQVVRFPIQINIPSGKKSKHNIIMRFEYDSI